MMNPAFMEMVQLHERSWGTAIYPERPSLADLLSAPLVAMWTEPIDTPPPSSPRLPTAKRDTARDTVNAPGNKFLLSVHQTPDELNEILTSLILLGKTSTYARRKLVKLYINQSPAEIVGVRLMIKEKSG